jgi:hypothetical protein
MRGSRIPQILPFLLKSTTRMSNICSWERERVPVIVAIGFPHFGFRSVAAALPTALEMSGTGVRSPDGSLLIRPSSSNQGFAIRDAEMLVMG